jgi:hypothetical protein
VKTGSFQSSEYTGRVAQKRRRAIPFFILSLSATLGGI